MPAKSPVATDAAVTGLTTLGEQIRARRKGLGISATAAAQAAGVSRVTWHRIEGGAPSVTMGAYLNAMVALGLSFGILAPPDASVASPHRPAEREGWLPARIRLADYPQLRQLAWQIQGTDALTPAEALGIYERNARHLDREVMEPRERHLLDALRQALRDGEKARV